TFQVFRQFAQRAAHQDDVGFETRARDRDFACLVDEAVEQRSAHANGGGRRIGRGGIPGARVATGVGAGEAAPVDRRTGGQDGGGGSRGLRGGLGRRGRRRGDGRRSLGEGLRPLRRRGRRRSDRGGRGHGRGLGRRSRRLRRGGHGLAALQALEFLAQRV